MKHILNKIQDLLHYRSINLTKDAIPEHAQNLHPNQQQSHYFADKVEKSQGVVQNSLSN